MRQAKQLTLRLPPDLYAKSVRMAKRRKLSLNKLAQVGLERLAAEEANAELIAAYNLVGSDPAESDVEFYLAAQREVVLGDD